MHRSSNRSKRDATWVMTNSLTRQAEEGGQALINSLAVHWPFNSKTIWGSTAKNLSSCLLEAESPCIEQTYASNFISRSGKCLCTQRGSLTGGKTRVPSAGETMRIFHGFVKYIFQQPCMLVKTKILEDVSGNHAADPASDTHSKAYPTEAAVRQQEAKKKLKLAATTTTPITIVTNFLK